MSIAWRLLLCFFLAFNITPNEAKAPFLRIKYENNEDLEKTSDINRVEDKNLDGSSAGNKPILRGFGNEDNFNKLLFAVDQVAENENKYAYNNRNEDRYDIENTQKDYSYEERNDNNIAVKDDSIEDGHSLEAVHNKRLNKLLAILLLNSNTNEDSTDTSDHDYSVESKSYDHNESVKMVDLLSYIQDNVLRKKKGIWATCGKKAAKYCKKACKDVVNSRCYGSECKKKMKKRIKKECKSSCNDRFRTD